MVAVIAGVRSLHNVGSMFRSADAAGVEKIFLAGITPSPLDRFGKARREMAKVALGAEKTVLWEKVSRLAPLLSRLKRDGYRIFAVEQAKGAIPYYRARAREKKIAFMVGNEVRGLTPALLKRCDAILEIPMRGEKESLNVSVAFGIVAFHLAHQEGLVSLNGAKKGV